MLPAFFFSNNSEDKDTIYFTQKKEEFEAERCKQIYTTSLYKSKACIENTMEV